MELCDRVREVLGDVQAAVRDFRDMRERVPAMVEAARAAAVRYSADEVEEAVAFLGWLSRTTSCSSATASTPSTARRVSIVPGSGLGILADEASSHYREPMPLMSIEPRLRERITGGDLLLVSKTNRFATVHRHERMDYVGVKQRRRERRDPARAAPDRAVHVEGVRRAGRPGTDPAPQAAPDHRGRGPDRGHARLQGGGRPVRVVPEGRPVRRRRRRPAHRGDGPPAPEERRQVKMFVRHDAEGRSVSITIALPRDRYNVELQQRLLELVQARFGGESVDQYLSLGETELAARIHFTVHVTGPPPDVSLTELEHEVIALTRTWDDRLRERLVAIYGEEHGVRLAETYRDAVPRLLQELDRHLDGAGRRRAVREPRRRRAVPRRAAERARGPAGPDARRHLQDRWQGAAVRGAADSREPRPAGR